MNLDDFNFDWSQVPIPDDSQQSVGTFFAYPDDIAAYQRAKEAGASEQEALQVGDNGVGRWGDNTTDPNVPMVALPPSDIVKHWGSVDAGRGKAVQVYGPNGQTVIAKVADIGPHGKLDLNPGATRALFPDGASSAAIREGHVPIAYRPVDSPDAFSEKVQADIAAGPKSAGPIDPQAAADIADSQEAADAADSGSDSGSDVESSDGTIATAPVRSKPMELNIQSLVSSPIDSDNGIIKKYKSGLVVNRAAGIMTYVDPMTNKVYQADKSGKFLDVTPANQSQKHFMIDPITGLKREAELKDGKLVPIPAEGEGALEPDPNAHGEDILKHLPADEQETAKAVAEYNAAPLTLSQRSQRNYRIMAAARRYRRDVYGDELDANMYQTRASLQKDYRRGSPASPGGQINAANAVVEHAAKLIDQAGALSNAGIKGERELSKIIKEQGNNPGLQEFLSTRDTISGELRRFYSGGQGSLTELNELQSRLGAARSIDELKGVVKNSILPNMEAKLNQLGYQWETAFDSPYKGLVNPQAAATLKKSGYSNFAGVDLTKVDKTGAPIVAPPKSFTTLDGKTVKVGDPVRGPNGEILHVQEDGTAR